MYTFFPVLAFLVIWLTTLTFVKGVRYSFLAAAVVWGLALVGITELLSVFSLITFGGLLTAWILVIIFVIIFFVVRIRILLTRHADSLFSDEDHRHDVHFAFDALIHFKFRLFYFTFPAIQHFPVTTLVIQRTRRFMPCKNVICFSA